MGSCKSSEIFYNLKWLMFRRTVRWWLFRRQRKLGEFSLELPCPDPPKIRWAHTGMLGSPVQFYIGIHFQPTVAITRLSSTLLCLWFFPTTNICCWEVDCVRTWRQAHAGPIGGGGANYTASGIRQSFPFSVSFPCPRSTYFRSLLYCNICIQFWNVPELTL